ncbi:MAG TPA: hypothetical protein PLY86_21010 [bacterium]|nr:hypothetical protein [bacterium]
MMIAELTVPECKDARESRSGSAGDQEEQVLSLPQVMKENERPQREGGEGFQDMGGDESVVIPEFEQKRPNGWVLAESMGSVSLEFVS